MNLIFPIIPESDFKSSMEQISDLSVPIYVSAPFDIEPKKSLDYVKKMGATINKLGGIPLISFDKDVLKIIRDPEYQLTNPLKNQIPSLQCLSNIVFTLPSISSGLDWEKSPLCEQEFEWAYSNNHPCVYGDTLVAGLLIFINKSNFSADPKHEKTSLLNSI